MNRLLAILIIFLILFPGWIFSQSSSVEKGISVSLTIPTSSSTGGGMPALVSAKVIFEGKAYPGAFLVLLKNNKVAATFLADETGFFRKELTGLPSGKYNFGIFAEDNEGRKSSTLTFSVTVLRSSLVTITGIFIPPTIFLFPREVEKGQKIHISGQVFPESQVSIFISPLEVTKKTIADYQGKWHFDLDTTVLKEGDYSVRAKAFFKDKEQSEFSLGFPFSILSSKCQGADLNFDDWVNIIDFSILLYFWNQTEPANICADINADGAVNIFDFSIMMYQWTG